MDNSPICPWCGKACHLSRTAALRSVRYQRTRYRRHLRLRAYRCPIGHGWHLTSRRPRRQNRSSRWPPRISSPRAGLTGHQ